MYMNRGIRVGNFPVFGPDGAYIDSAQGLSTGIVNAVSPVDGSQRLETISMSPATMPDEAMAIEVSYTGDPEFDVRSENGGTLPAEGTPMLTWLALGSVALVAWFGLQRARR